MPQRKGIPMIPNLKKKQTIWGNVIWSIFPWFDQAESISCLWNRSLLRLWWSFDSIQTQLPKELWKSSTSKCWSSSVKSWTADLSAKLPPKKSALANWMTPKLKNSDTSLVSKKKIDFGGSMGTSKAGCAKMEEARDRPCTTCTSVKKSFHLWHHGA